MLFKQAEDFAAALAASKGQISHADTDGVSLHNCAHRHIRLPLFVPGLRLSIG